MGSWSYVQCLSTKEILKLIACQIWYLYQEHTKFLTETIKNMKPGVSCYEIILTLFFFLFAKYFLLIKNMRLATIENFYVNCSSQWRYLIMTISWVDSILPKKDIVIPISPVNAVQGVTFSLWLLSQSCFHCDWWHRMCL